jgi:hypothetical protein
MCSYMIVPMSSGTSKNQRACKSQAGLGPKLCKFVT